jgi:hypothetical protein
MTVPEMRNMARQGVTRANCGELVVLESAMGDDLNMTLCLDLDPKERRDKACHG